MIECSNYFLFVSIKGYPIFMNYIKKNSTKDKAYLMQNSLVYIFAQNSTYCEYSVKEIAKLNLMFIIDYKKDF